MYQVLQIQEDPSALSEAAVHVDSKGRTLLASRTGLGGEIIAQRSYYSPQGRLSRREVPHRLGTTAPGETVFHYDALGTLTTVLEPTESGTHTSRFTYGTRYTSDVLPEPEPGQPAITFVARKVDSDGNVTTSFLGPLQQAHLQRTGKGPDATEMRMTYGAFGEVASLVGARNQMTIERDLWGRVRSVSDSDIGTLSYDYDPFDRLIHATDADGTETSYEYDVLDRLIEVTHGAEAERFIFDRDLEGEADGEPAADNALGRLVRSTRTTPTGTVTQRFRYEARPGSGTALDNRALLESVQLETPEATFETRYEYYPGTARVLTQHYPDAYPGGGLAVVYCYDEQGAVTRASAPHPLFSCDSDEGDVAPYWKRTSIYGGLAVDGVELGNGVDIDIAIDETTLRLAGHQIIGTDATIGLSYEYEGGGRLRKETRSGSGGIEDVSFDRLYSYTGEGLLEGVTDAVTGTPIHSPTYTAGKQLETSGRSDLGTFSYGGVDGPLLGNRLARGASAWRAGRGRARVRV